MMQRERSDVYIIPPNFAKEGTLFSGRIEGRNAFEAAVLFIILFRILLFLDVSIKIRIYIGIIVILPLTILAVVGVNGESLLSFIIQFIRFVTRRRVVTVPDGQYRLKRNRRIRRQQKKQQKQERKKKKRQQEGGVKDRKRSRRIEAKAERSSACREERYISLRCKDGYRGYVLLEKGRNYLLSEYEKELSFFISGSGQTGHVKSEPEKRMRLYRMSEVWVFFWKAGIEILRNHKPDMDKGFVRDRGKAFYYGSLEFKGMSEAIRGSRSCGVLLSGDTALVVYNTMDRNMKWAKKMECSMRTWTERMLLKGGYNSRADALIVGQNIKVLLKLLESDGGIKKDLFRPDDIYDQYYYIPMCQEGILQIILLTEKQKREKLKQFLLSRFPIRKEKEYAVYAVCDEIGNPVYLGYDLEMRQLCRIKQELLWRPSVSIVCMDYQAEIIREYLGEKVIIYELNTENVMKYLINDIGE